MNSILEQLEQLKENKDYDSNKLMDICSNMEELIGADVMWRTLKYGFEVNEFLENLEYIARETDL